MKITSIRQLRLLSPVINLHFDDSGAISHDLIDLLLFSLLILNFLFCSICHLCSASRLSVKWELNTSKGAAHYYEQLELYIQYCPGANHQSVAKFFSFNKDIRSTQICDTGFDSSSLRVY